MDILAVENYILEKLKKNLSPTLTYHGYHHTIDVAEAVLKIASSEGIEEEEPLILLKTAAFYHDLGFITTYRGHEEESCRIANLTLPSFGYSNPQIEKICGMIMATKIPQTPLTHLEQIIADADLDYLGRDDFWPIAHSLYEELREREMVPNIETWNQIQVKFLSSHQYWTASAQYWRKAKKQQYLDELCEITKHY
ncbi:HD domain-containing protein [Runella sp. MFBS21]|uniref:HD domain-containing protein n=1 Tax=Runella sp. MFBS21 TaxID=3034018 RepID=UPI0023F6626E|nr:HD domain-containing protein [Runella sp. MFBS21]MDF7818320.1 HD domain-containing protein [Runella sp. MFBS21]